jgi:hypothetical protein
MTDRRSTELRSSIRDAPWPLSHSCLAYRVQAQVLYRRRYSNLPLCLSSTHDSGYSGQERGLALS